MHVPDVGHNFGPLNYWAYFENGLRMRSPRKEFDVFNEINKEDIGFGLGSKLNML